MPSQEKVAAEETVFTHWQRNILVASLGAFTTIVGMTLLLPFLPLYVEELGVKGNAAIAQWSGIVYGATFFAAALVAPLWGRLGDRYGRKPMLVRASLGMALAIGLMGMATNIWQLLALRLFTGLAGGYASGASILAATQAPRDKTGWALGIVTTGIMGGNFLGPLIGGILPHYIGVRQSFWLIGTIIFITFLATTFLIREERQIFKKRRQQKPEKLWQGIDNKTPVILMLLTGTFVTFAMMSIEPIITLYIATLTQSSKSITFWAGIVMALTALGSALSASPFGRLADRIGHWKLLYGLMALSALLVLPQAFVTNPLQLAILRFLMGLTLGGLLPAISAVLRHNIPEKTLGAMLGFSVSANYIGQVSGPVIGGFIAGHYGMKAVFFITALLMAVCAFLNFTFARRIY